MPFMLFLRPLLRANTAPRGGGGQAAGMSDCPFGQLGLSPHASQAEVKEAYRSLGACTHAPLPALQHPPCKWRTHTQEPAFVDPCVRARVSQPRKRIQT